MSELRALSAGSQRLRVVFAVPALLGIFLVGQAILNARAIRLDLTPERRYVLSDRAKHILAELPADVRVLAFLRSQDPRNTAIDDMLEQVVAQTPRVRVERYDVNRTPALARHYGVDSYGALVVESDGRRRTFSNPREEVFLAALLQVTRQQRKTVSWVVGHGEGDLDDVARRDGFATARVFLEQEYYEVRPVSLLGAEVPPETAVLVIAGPQKDFLVEELGSLRRYLQRPGHALVMLDPLRAPELAAMLEEVGVLLRPDVVIEPEASLYAGEPLTMRITVEADDHRIVAPLDTGPLFSLVRSVDAVADDSGSTMGVPFLRTSASSWATTDTGVIRAGAPVFSPQRDRPGPVTVGLEVAFRTLTPPGMEPQQGRLVVYGCSRFATNAYIDYLGNKDLFLNTIGWLAREPQSVGRRPRQQELGRHQLFVSTEQGNVMFWTTAVLQPALFAAIGLAISFWRRRS